MSTPTEEASAARATARELVARFLRETSGLHSWAAGSVKPGEHRSGRALLDAAPAVQIAAVRVILATMAQRGYGRAIPMSGIQEGLARLASAVTEVARASSEWVARRSGDDSAEAEAEAERLPLPGSSLDDWELRVRLGKLLGVLTRRALPYSTADLCFVVATLSRIERWDYFPVQSLLRSIQRRVDECGLAPELREVLQQARAAASARQASFADGRKALALIDELLGDGPGKEVQIDPDDDWGALARPALDALDPAERGPWLGLLAHAQTATASKPSATWLKEARRRVETMGQDAFVARASAWLALLSASTSNQLRRGAGIGLMAGLDEVPRAVPTDRNATLLRGLIWCCATLDDEALARAVADAGAACFKKIPEIGARSTKVGNACLWALGAMAGPHGATQLVRLQREVKQPSARGRLDASMEQAAQRAGLTRDDLEDRAVPTHGLDGGRLRTTVGPYTAELVVRGPRDVELRWLDPTGAPRGEPPEARGAHADELKRLQRTADDVRKTLLAQRDRIERLFLSEQSWPLVAWRALYLEHPLLGVLAQRLIWTFEIGDQPAPGAWHDGRLVDAADRPLDGLADDSRVRLWHPITSPADEVLAWREWLERHEVTQPFKQAHREIYLLTDAERQTHTHSNRFAEHILRQHQFRALCRERGWQYALQGGFDGDYQPPTLLLPRQGLRAKLSVEAIDDDDMMSPSGIYLYVLTEQVQFTRQAPSPGRAPRTPTQERRSMLRDVMAALRRGDLPAVYSASAPLLGPELSPPLPLAEVPPVVFSEVMRDVDLFVGVCSVGADPAWLDRAPDRYAHYWQGFSFGELLPSAQTRRLVLERLLPRLNIAPRCQLDDRFLVVQGDLRTYRIHLGSGNIQMEPNSQYLCIVPRRGADVPGDPGHLYLPFEGDPMLSVILSKAFLLANDRAIKDPTITRQIAGALS